MMMFRSLLVGSVVASSLAVGCSEPVALPASGASVVSFNGSSAGGGTCRVGAQFNSRIGYVTTEEVRTVVQDNEAGSTLYCSVSGSSTFQVTGFMDVQGTHLEFSIDAISAANNSGDPAKGSVSFANVNTVKTYASPVDRPCDFWFEGKGQGVKEGEIWAQFECPVIRNSATDSDCHIAKSSIVVMKDCEI